MQTTWSQLPGLARASFNSPSDGDTYRDYHFTLPGQYTTSLLRAPGIVGTQNDMSLRITSSTKYLVLRYSHLAPCAGDP